MKSGEVDRDGLVVSSSQTTPLLQLVDAAFHGVAQIVFMTCSHAGASPGLSGGEHEGQRSAVTVSSQVNLGGESSAGASQGMVIRLPDMGAFAAGSGAC